MNFIRLVVNQTFKTNLLQIRTQSCWSCGKNVDNFLSNLFCKHCNALQEPDQKRNYFDILGVIENYDLDENELSKKYRDLQKYLHPDKFGNRNKKEQEISEKYSSLVNEAYKTLLDPLSRGIYMLHLKGKEIPEKTQVDQTFLLKIMAINEEVEEAESEEDIMELNKKNKMVIKELQQQVSNAFFNGDLKEVVRLLGIMKYYTSIDSQIQAAIRSKGIIR